MRVVEGGVVGCRRTPRPLVASIRAVTESPMPKSCFSISNNHGKNSLLLELTVDIPIITSSVPNFLRIVNLTVSLTRNMVTNVARRIHVAVVKANDLSVAVTDVALMTSNIVTLRTGGQ